MTEPVPVGLDEKLSNEALLAILAGCEGATPGPYSINHGSENHHHCRLFDGEGREVLRTEWDKGLNAHRNVAHFARLDPGTVKALVTELLERRRTPANEGGEAGEWRYSINYGPEGEENWANLITPEGQHVANIRTHHARRIVAALTASPSSPVAPEGVRVSYAKIIEIVNDCSERMKRSGESHRMLAKWVSEGINAALTPAAEQGETDMVLWKHDAPFITQVSQPDGKKFVSVAVRSFDALNEAHDLIVNAFKEAGAK
jgi:hypothetical protein